MGYFARGTGSITIDSSKLDKLFLAVRMMLNETDMMRGGVWANGTLSNRSYAWVDSNRLSDACSKKDLKQVFQCWGFFIDPTNKENEYIIDFDNKLGDEEQFIKKIAPFVKRGEINWTGEDGEMWRNDFKEGQMRTQYAKITYE